MSYRGLGVDFFYDESATGVYDPYDYLSGGVGYGVLQNVMNDAVTLLLSGQSGDIDIGRRYHVTWVDSHPEISAVFGSHEDTARLIGHTVLETLVSVEREKPLGSRATFSSLAPVLVGALVEVLRHGGDPASCMMSFEAAYGDLQKISVLSVPKTVSRTGWCEKDVVFPHSGQTITSCVPALMCKKGVDTQGTTFVKTAPPPSPGDIRATPPGSTAPAPAPTRADVERQVDEKMKGKGETFESLNIKAEYGELAQYLSALSQVKRWLVYSLGLPDKATDKEVANRLLKLGIWPGEAADWFRGCNFDTDCFRLTMNQALGEAKQEVRDNRAKVVAAALGLGALGTALYFWVRR
jgi:hypothetical protein